MRYALAATAIILVALTGWAVGVALLCAAHLTGVALVVVPFLLTFPPGIVAGFVLTEVWWL